MVLDGKYLPLAVVLVVLSIYTNADYVKRSILCDSIPDICENAELSYDALNLTICGNKQRFLNPAICNCGYMCLGVINETDSCSTSASKMFPEAICGPRLECLSEKVTAEDATCSLNPEKECIAGSMTYDYDTELGQVGPGQYRPNCKDDGSYASRQCSPGSTCYCVDEKNNRIFGEAPITTLETMNCDCAAYWLDMESKDFEKKLRCLPNGNFDPLYCDGDFCICYNHTKHEVDQLSSRTMVTEMLCYNQGYHNENYVNICHRDQEEWDMQGGNTSIIIEETRRPVCTPDGFYAPVQVIGPNATCVDYNGKMLENFTMPLYMSDGMTCNCARRRFIMEENGLGASKPRCCLNGGFNPIQTRGLLAYCVDNYGNQAGEERPITDIVSLQCTSAAPCPVMDDISFILLDLETVQS